MQLDTHEFDTSVKPGDDFFGLVNNKWIAKNPIPEGKVTWGVVPMIETRVNGQLKAILDSLSQQSKIVPGSNVQKLRDYYTTAMDIDRLNRVGHTPLEHFIDLITSIQNLDEFIQVVGYLHRTCAMPLWNVTISPDQRNSKLLALHISQGGFSLTGKLGTQCYENNNENGQKLRNKYFSFIKDLFTKIDWDTLSAVQAAQTVINLETQITNFTVPHPALSDPSLQYNKMTPEELAKIAPSINWQLYFKSIGAEPEYIIVGEPEFFARLSRFLDSASLGSLKLYLAWWVLNGLSRYLTEDLEQMSFNFYEVTFKNVTQQLPRWQRVLSMTNMQLGSALGKLYVERNFDNKMKEKITSIANVITTAYRFRIEKLEWMGPVTKQRALKKLDNMIWKLGYPETWIDYTDFEVGTNSYAENYIRGVMFGFDKQISSLGKTINRYEWYMNPQTANAGYNPLTNDMCVAAAFLQPPLFDINSDIASTLGAIGAIKGHEITHGFDPGGSKFGPDGNLENWWEHEDMQRFAAKFKKIIAQFNLYEPLPGHKVDGVQTVGENVADLGGLAISYDALQLIMDKENYTEEQRLLANKNFFISFARARCVYFDEKVLEAYTRDNYHAPAEFRVNGPLSNFNPWYEAFKITGGNLWRNPEDRIEIW